MIKYNYGVLSSSVIIDQRTGQLSLINIIDQVTVESLPTGIPNVSFATFWSRTENIDKDETYTGRLARSPEVSSEIRDLDKPEFDIRFDKGSKEARVILGFGGILISNEGENFFNFEIKDRDQWTHSGGIKLEVNKAPDPSSVSESPALQE